MAEYGYEAELFPNMQGEMFNCPICLNVVKRPKECTGCGDLFCGKCIDDWTRKNKYLSSYPAPVPNAAPQASRPCPVLPLFASMRHLT